MGTVPTVARSKLQPAEAGFLLAQQHKYMTMPIEITPGITITAGLVIGAGEPVPVTGEVIVTESDLWLATESDLVLITE
jgi:hypothetical protein